MTEQAMVERVRDAIMKAAFLMNDYGTPSLENPEECARAAIETMREPTLAMINAGDKVVIKDPSIMADEVWEAMIDAALAEQK